jgi:transcription elongation factor Elf1
MKKKNLKQEKNKKSDKIKTLWLCPHCGSDNTEFKVWARANTNEIVDSNPIEEEDGWCEDCEQHGELILSTLKEKAKVVGFQVVGDEGTKEEGLIHPDMQASFCLYSLSQANAMLEKSNVWKLLTIWSGDVEEPTMMFKGDPRK